MAESAEQSGDALRAMCGAGGGAARRGAAHKAAAAEKILIRLSPQYAGFYFIKFGLCYMDKYDF